MVGWRMPDIVLNGAPYGLTFGSPQRTARIGEVAPMATWPLNSRLTGTGTERRYARYERNRPQWVHRQADDITIRPKRPNARTGLSPRRRPGASVHASVDGLRCQVARRPRNLQLRAPSAGGCCHD